MIFDHDVYFIFDNKYLKPKYTETYLLNYKDINMSSSPIDTLQLVTEVSMFY